MNADQRRWILIATMTPFFGAIHGAAADITPPSERQLTKGVAECADEFADAELAQKPLLEWTLPFTQEIAVRGSKPAPIVLRFRRIGSGEPEAPKRPNWNLLAGDSLLELTLNFSQFIASGDAVRLTHSGWSQSTRYPSRIRIDDGDELLGMKPTMVELFIKRGFPLGDWNDSPVLSWMTDPHTPDISYHLAEEDFTFGGMRFSR